VMEKRRRLKKKPAPELRSLGKNAVCRRGDSGGVADKVGVG